MRDRVGIVAQELCSLANVTVIEGSLSDPRTIENLFREPVELAFINTTHWGNEIAIGKALVDAAKRAGVKHFIYSSMPDHSRSGNWQALPLWASKAVVEDYLRSSRIPATYIYCGTYHNNFTSLPYPLFRLQLLDDGSFEWQAPFNPHKPLPWLDAEHDVGPVVLQIFKDGPQKWANQRIPLFFEYLTPLEACDAFSRALSRRVTYVRGPIDIEISIPTGYREHLSILEQTLGWHEAPYFGPDLEVPHMLGVARELWEGNRSLEEYAREVFPVEEAANGVTWMEEGDEPNREIELNFQALSF